MLLLALAIGASVVHGQSLPEVVRLALQEHPRMRAAAAGVEASGFVLEQVRAARLPQLAMIADPGRRTSATVPRDAVGDLGLRASLLLFDGGRTRESIARETERGAAARESLRFSAEALAAQVTELYVECYRQERLAALAADNVDAHEALHARVREIASFDRGRASDQLQVGARLEQARLALALHQGAAAEARSMLADVVAVEVSASEAPPSPRAALPLSLNDALSMLDRHPAVRAAEAEAQAAQRAARLAAAWSLPRIDVVAVVDSPVDPLGQRQHFDDVSVRLAASWMPIDGGAGRAGVRAAERQGVQAREGARAVRRELSARVAGLWAQRESRRQRSQTHRALVESTLQVREAYWQQFTIGRRSIVDLLNAEGEFFQARLAEEDERLGTLQAEFRLLAATARLAAGLGITVPENDE